MLVNHHRHAARRAAFAAAVLAFASPAAAGDMVFFAGGVSSRLNVESLAERKFATVVRQQYDYSCGSAAIATLLTHHYDKEVSETDAFRAMWEVGEQERIRKVGFSLLEMKRYLEAIGLTADGFKLSLERVAEIGVPGVALIDNGGYKHFVVIKGIAGGRVLVGDPAKGLIAYSPGEFKAIWDGIILFVRSDVERGRDHFNHAADWRRSPFGPVARSLDAEPLQSVLLSQSRVSASGFSILTTRTIDQ